MSRGKPIADLVAEQTLLAALLLGGDLGAEYADVIAQHVTAQDFYDDRHGRLYAATGALRAAGRPCGMGDVAEAHGADVERFGGHEYLLGLGDHLCTPAEAETLAKRVAELAVVRRAIETMQRAQAEAQDGCEDWGGWLDRTASAMVHAADRRGEHDAVTLEHAAEAVVADMVSGKPPLGVQTGYLDLDRYTLGLHPGALTIVAGRPAHGKTAFGLGLAMGVADNARAPVLVCSLEMPARELSQRALAMRSGVDGMRIRSYRLNRDDFALITRVVDRFNGADGVWIDDEPAITVASVARKLAKLERRTRKRAAAVVVDYLQLMRGGDRGMPREQEISSISRDLKSLAKRAHLPVVALCQLNREVEKSHRKPQLSDLRESGAIEQDADSVLFVWREEMLRPSPENAGLAEIIVGKQRSGPTGIVQLAYRAECARFDNLERYEQSA